MMAAFVDDPRQVTRQQMDAWAADFDGWALRRIGRRNAALYGAALEVAERLAAADDALSRWIGKDALWELKSHRVIARLQVP
jgi:hypothetical protein